MSVARGTLDAARFFTSEAEKALEGDPAGLRHYLEAAIVFARSVTFHTQKEFASAPGFESWYNSWRVRLGRDLVASYFLEKRNYVLKEGRVALSHQISAHFGAFVVVSGFSSMKVIRGRPWYRRSPSILWQDFVRPLQEWRGRRREERTRRRRERELRERQEAADKRAARRSVGFVDSPLPELSAIELLNRYLDQLTILVDEAEARFASG